MRRGSRFAWAFFVLSAAYVAACSSDENGADSTEDGGASSSGGSSSGEASSSGGSSSGGSSGGASSSGGSSSGGAAPTHTDGIKNLDETDIDCGGAEAPKCVDGKGCAAGGDCTSGVCDATAKKCSAPAGNDGVKNGDETDLDCGGTTTGAPKCAVGKTCKVHADCASDGCDYNKKCADARSCTQHYGGDTCGPAATQESCCKSIAPTGTTVKIDKYAITAGRFRQFVERTNGNIRGWIQANRPTWWETAWDAYVPNQLDDNNNYPTHNGVYQELGPDLFFAAAGGNQGCQIESYGARTYRLPDAINTRFGDGQHYTQDDLDAKAMQCATFFLLSAFCAWDGGRLPSVAELNLAWGAAKYPWGATPNPAGWNDSWNNLTEAQANGSVKPVGGDQTYASYNYNWWSPANRVCSGNAWCDYSVHVAPPGRFPNGNGPFGHADLGGNVFNITNEIQGTAGSDPSARKVVWFRNGSWQGHTIPFYAANSATPSSFKSESKYWATGARCAR